MANKILKATMHTLDFFFCLKSHKKNSGEYTLEKIDTGKIENLQKIYNQQIRVYLNADKLRTKKMFIEYELDKAKMFQIRFTDYRTDKQQLLYWTDLQNWIDFLEGKLKKPKPKKSKLSYQWQNKPNEELPELYELLLNKYKLISPETTLEQFKGIFTGQPLESIKPVKWHDNNTSELLYFIKGLKKNDNIELNIKRSDYIKMTSCIVKPDGRKFEANFKELNQNISINLSIKKRETINDLVDNFR
jgi:hypothetical protein